MKKIEIEKNNQRVLCSKKRKILIKNNTDAPFKIIKQILKIKNFQNLKIIASFISIKTEIFMDPLNNFLFKSNKNVCLPVIKKKNCPLIFRNYNNKTQLIKNKYGVLEPDKLNKEVMPDLILTPCLAFDKNGYRLGYGGGYYDRTFFHFHKLGHSFISVVVAYEGQMVDQIIKSSYDQKIDYILTENKLYKSK